MLKQIRWYLETALFVAVSFAVALLPDRVALAAGRCIGRLFFRLVKGRRRVAIENIAASLPFLESQPGWRGGTAEQLARETFENLGCCVVEVCKLYRGKGQGLIDSVEFRGLEHYEAALAKGKGIAFITAHCGNWELMALAFGVRHHEISVVARRQDNPHLNALIEKIRKAYGNGVIYKDGALRSMFAALKKQEIVGLLIDQAVHPDGGVLVDFLGRPAWTIRLPALIGRKSGAPMVPGFIHREGSKNIVTLYPEYQMSTLEDPELAAAEDTRALTRFIEEYVIQHPTQWYWVHKRWKNSPAPAVADGAASD
ncbi:lipid A biosynthesis acyltransferase [Geoanaerobacter pelophilus]|uniref:Lipid A biosynthesis acyltransferase n=1 Tax=Geoanaerobacter pelophilus TaxID=60036 RepID=A0ABQ0MPP8_9BACT|nr:lysophospholipid acyltransferase family protein [Geoanaerobacter pelophilus]GAW69051.1 lipid A biosynthesis acyltransferase [Geoanaerobacter pelophilus]